VTGRRRCYDGLVSTRLRPPASLRSAVVGFLLAVTITAAFCAFVWTALWLWGAGAFLSAITLAVLAIGLLLFVWRERVRLEWVALGLLFEVVVGMAVVIVWAIESNLGFKD